LNSRAIPKDGAEALVLLLKHWRLIAASALFQVVSGVVSVVSLKPEGDPFMDFWLGAVVAGPVGLVFGLLWHIANQERRRSTHWLLVGFLFLCAIMVPVLGWPAARR